MTRTLHHTSSLDHASPVQNAKDILHKLVAFNTASSGHRNFAQDTRAATEYVGGFLAKETGATSYYGKPYEYPPNSGKMHQSLVAVWQPETEPTEPPLAFSGHIDTVPAIGLWKSEDPHLAREQDGKIIGRGALDMKGQIASFMATMQKLHKSGQLKDLDRPVMLMLSSCEEVGVLGASDVSALARKKGLRPSEVVVMEPTDGYVGLGAKGGRLEKLDFTRKDDAEPPSENWPHYCTVTFQSKGGHSSLQGGSPADPARAATGVLQLVRQLRKHRIPAEICNAQYGMADNITGGAMTLTIGYDQPLHSGDAFQLFEIPKWIERQLLSRKQDANLHLATLNVAANAINTVKNEIRGMDFGELSVKVKNLSHCDTHEQYPRMPCDTENGSHNHNAVEHALEVAEQIYQLHKDQDKGGLPKDYALPTLGLTSLTVPLLQGNSRTASLSYDMRYPVEAQDENSARIETAESLSQKIHAAARANAEINAEITSQLDIKPYEVSPTDSRLKPYVEIARETGFAKYRTTLTNLPYNSDGNVISREFKDALVVTMAAGGFSNQPHGEGEHLTEQQIRKNMQVMEAIIAQRGLSQTPFKGRG